jgi:polyphosphate kinase 2 (PPK2 family)
VKKSVWKQRYEHMRHFEDYLTANGTVVRKFFLHVSREEQRKRFLARIDDATKNWKFSMGDVAERQHWGEYMAAYEQTIRGTASAHAPWHVVPADNKWFTRLVVAAVIAETLDSLDLQFPQLKPAQRKELASARARLTRD